MNETPAPRPHICVNKLSRCAAAATADASDASNPARRRASLALAFGLAAALGGCGLFAPPPPPPPPPPKPPPPPPRLMISVNAAASLNPDVNGRASPVMVRLYELKSPAQFNAVDFMALFDQDRSALAADIVLREEFVLRPGESKKIDKLLAPETQAVALMAAFRDIEHARWRAVAPLAAGKDNTVAISLQDVAVKIEQSAKDVPEPKLPPPPPPKPK